MVARPRFPRFASTFPFTAAAILVAALAAPGCDGGSSTSSNTGGGTSGTGGTGSGDCPATCGGDTPVCDPDTNTCVGCLPANDTCDDGKICDPDSLSCEDGCKTDAECDSPLTCDPSSHQCVTCTSDAQCEAGSVCSPSGECVTGCSDSQPCSDGLACCSGACTDLSNDPKSCGMCALPCENLAHAAEACVEGICQLGTCEGDYADCNQDQADGCEWDIAFYGPCSCAPGEMQECYSGAAGTKDVGTCHAGIAVCDPSGTKWGPCDGQVIPMFDTCSDGQDNDCDGTPDNAKDLDGDGWTPCDGDCCDVLMVGVCGDPGLVNPGSYEVGGNMVDDDCNGTVDDVLAACDAGLVSNSAAATDYAKAIDLCATTTLNPALKDKKWGVISAKLSLASGNGTVAANSRSIRPGFGTNIVPLGGSRLAVLSTGYAADVNDASPSFKDFQDDLSGGQNMGTSSSMPSDWLGSNGGTPPNAPQCPAPADTTANDPVMLTLQVRAPTNAKSFAVSSFFFSSEYPEWTCSPYNDFFLTLLDSTFVAGAGQVANPADKNLAFYSSANGKYPVGVNLAHNGTGLFNQCENGATGCQPGTIAGNTNNTCVGTNLLTGTGFDKDGGNTYVCGNNDLVGGGTGWLTTNGNVKPGETITLRFAIWDTSDHIYDSLVLVDNFLWSLDASTPGTHE